MDNTRFKIDDSFLGRYQKLVKEVVIPYQEKILKDEIPGAEKSHAIENFIQAGEVLTKGKCDKEFYGMVFQDSDVAKWLEAAAYSLEVYPDLELEKRCDEIIDIIKRAQHENGYLNTYFTVKEPKKEWTDLTEAHELYCAGHMIEAAVAYAKATGKELLLEIMCKMSDHIYEVFIAEKKEGYPGHPEIELALMRLYHYTNNEKYSELAKHFVDVRGVDPEYFEKESKDRDWFVWNKIPPNREYGQNHMPVREQNKAVGHAVRAVYLYTGMAELANKYNDTTLIKACETLFDNIVNQRMYITGAIGSAYEGEAFTKDYHLPNDTAYAETCASIGLIFFANKMLEINKNSKYVDVIERALYNCVLAGMQLDGKKFFYVNPLEVIPGISKEAVTHHHSLPVRPGWFACACCPPNVARLLLSLSSYTWAEDENCIYSCLFIGGSYSINENDNIKVETSYPYGNEVKYIFELKNKELVLNKKFAIRVPKWSQEVTIKLNNEDVEYEIKEGFAYIDNDIIKDKDVISLGLDMSIKKIYSNQRVSSNNGKVSFMRGPLVYCAEGVDNSSSILDKVIKKEATPKELEYDKDKLNGIIQLEVQGYKIEEEKDLYTDVRPKRKDYKIKLIPYYAWANRVENQMRVWIPEE